MEEWRTMGVTDRRVLVFALVLWAGQLTVVKMDISPSQLTATCVPVCNPEGLFSQQQVSNLQTRISTVQSNTNADCPGVSEGIKAGVGIVDKMTGSNGLNTDQLKTRANDFATNLREMWNFNSGSCQNSAVFVYSRSANMIGWSAGSDVLKKVPYNRMDSMVNKAIKDVGRNPSSAPDVMASLIGQLQDESNGSSSTTATILAVVGGLLAVLAQVLIGFLIYSCVKTHQKQHLMEIGKADDEVSIMSGNAIFNPCCYCCCDDDDESVATLASEDDSNVEVIIPQWVLPAAKSQQPQQLSPVELIREAPTIDEDCIEDKWGIPSRNQAAENMAAAMAPTPVPMDPVVVVKVPEQQENSSEDEQEQQEIPTTRKVYSVINEDIIPQPQPEVLQPQPEPEMDIERTRIAIDIAGDGMHPGDVVKVVEPPARLFPPNITTPEPESTWVAPSTGCHYVLDPNSTSNIIPQPPGGVPDETGCHYVMDPSGAIYAQIQDPTTTSPSSPSSPIYAQIQDPISASTAGPTYGIFPVQDASTGEIVLVQAGQQQLQGQNPQLIPQDPTTLSAEAEGPIKIISDIPGIRYGSTQVVSSSTTTDIYTPVIKQRSPTTVVGTIQPLSPISGTDGATTIRSPSTSAGGCITIVRNDFGKWGTLIGIPEDDVLPPATRWPNTTSSGSYYTETGSLVGGSVFLNSDYEAVPVHRTMPSQEVENDLIKVSSPGRGRFEGDIYGENENNPGWLPSSEGFDRKKPCKLKPIIKGSKSWKSKHKKKKKHTKKGRGSPDPESESDDDGEKEGKSKKRKNKKSSKIKSSESDDSDSSGNSRKIKNSKKEESSSESESELESEQSDSESEESRSSSNSESESSSESKNSKSESESESSESSKSQDSDSESNSEESGSESKSESDNNKDSRGERSEDLSSSESDENKSEDSSNSNSDSSEPSGDEEEQEEEEDQEEEEEEVKEEEEEEDDEDDEEEEDEEEEEERPSIGVGGSVPRPPTPPISRSRSKSSKVSSKKSKQKKESSYYGRSSARRMSEDRLSDNSTQMTVMPTMAKKWSSKGGFSNGRSDLAYF